MVIASVLTVNRDRLFRNIEDLAQIGQIPNSGVCRIAYSDEDVQARNLIQRWMLEAGMSVRIDTAGNIIGTYPGKYPEAPVLATGSHIDTVPTGGRFDGTYGVLAGLEVVRVLRERQIRLNHSLEVIVFTDEEGSMTGCKAMAGKVVADAEYYRRSDGMDIQTCLRRVGGCWEQIDDAQRSAEDTAAFVELHVEQGPVLEFARKDIGVVEGIVGQRRYIISVQGSTSHAGTTPMNMRRDALVAASQIILAVNRIGNLRGQQVATVGWMQVSPNAMNSIPGFVELSLDIRDLSDSHLDQLMAQLRQDVEAIATETQTRITFAPRLYNEPAPASLRIQESITQVCQDLDLSYMTLPSRASHDAQEMAEFTDMGMIFVPSEGGISHAEVEYTSPEQCAQGATVLLHTLLKLDQAYAI